MQCFDEQCVNRSVVHEAKAECVTQSVRLTTEKERYDDTNTAKIKQKDKQIYKVEVVWLNVIGMTIMHSITIYGIYLIFTSAKIWTTLWASFYGYLGAFGISAGSHRLWSHRSYKARLPMRIFLMLLQSIANEDCIYYWVRDHRLHHKYTETDADPYNPLRGFVFSHMGWLLIKKHPDVKKFGKGIDLSDITSDPVVAFQKKYFLIIMPLMTFIIPTLIPMYFWNESFKVAICLNVAKWVISLHMIWTINSFAHIWGYKPYDGSSTSTDNPYLAVPMLGEGWHNYHHAFPWDYKVPDIPFYSVHPTGKFIEFFALLGLIYDLKTVSLDLAMKQANRSGDGTVQEPAIQDDADNYNFMHKSTVWGWDDKELKVDDRNGTDIHAIARARAIK